MNENELESEKIVVELTDDNYDALMRMFVEQFLREESLATFHDYINDGADTTTALSKAVINEMVIRALIDKIEREEFAAVLKNNHNKEANDDDTEDSR